MGGDSHPTDLATLPTVVMGVWPTELCKLQVLLAVIFVALSYYEQHDQDRVSTKCRETVHKPPQHQAVPPKHPNYHLDPMGLAGTEHSVHPNNKISSVCLFLEH